MIYHVLPGDAQVEAFRNGGFDGELIVCREALMHGPIDAPDLEQFWDDRARYIVAEYGGDEIAYHDHVARELARLLDVEPEDEVNLWFEYELFCSANMWFCLSLLKGAKATVYRVEPIGLEIEKRWDGFGHFTSDDMRTAFELRTRLSPEQVEMGAHLWDSYRLKDHGRLKELTAECDTDCFPYLKEVVAAVAEEDILPLEVVKEIVSGGNRDIAHVLPEFKKRAGVYGYGDLQVQRLIDQLGSS